MHSTVDLLASGASIVCISICILTNVVQLYGTIVQPVCAGAQIHCRARAMTALTLELWTAGRVSRELRFGT
jgi:hypothetical protein